MEIPKTVKLCSNCDWPYICCDHCNYFKFNPDEQDRYIDCGFCNLHYLPSDPGSSCEYYYCFRL